MENAHGKMDSRINHGMQRSVRLPTRCHRPINQINHIGIPTSYGLVRQSDRSKEDRIEHQRSIYPRPAFLYTWIRCIPGGCFFQLFIIMVSDGQNVSNSSWVHGVRIVLCRNCVLERAEDWVCVELSSPQRLTTIMKGSEGCPESDPTGNVMMIITELLYIS
jgi:hypothetical protein